MVQVYLLLIHMSFLTDRFIQVVVYLLLIHMIRMSGTGILIVNSMVTWWCFFHYRIGIIRPGLLFFARLFPLQNRSPDW